MKFVLAICVALPLAYAQPFPASSAKALDESIENAIRVGAAPGAVVQIGQRGRVLYRKAYGNRALVPAEEPMTEDTIFDCASLTKPVATTSAMMRLFEQGRVRLNDRVTEYLPEFQGGKSDITVRNLLTHFSGLRPDVDIKPEWSGYELGIQKALVDKPAGPPGVRFVYSDINFILLGEIVRRVTGQGLPGFVREALFGPLGMNESMFQPAASVRPRIAPTEVLKPGEAPLRGIVHDPTTRFMGGIAGHAGMFSTASDLAIFAEMMLGRGERNGKRIFQAATIEKFTTPQGPPDQRVLRGLGWDIDSPFSSNRGELFPVGSYGHTGFTGTSLWIDPRSGTYVILLANSVHPKIRSGMVALRARVATIAASAVGVPSAGTGYFETLAGSGLLAEAPRNESAATGLDEMVAQKFSPLAGKRVGLITNHTGVDRQGRRNIDLMKQAGVNLVAIYSPEHGVAGKKDEENVGDDVDEATGIKVYSLYAGKRRRPDDAMLRGVDVLVFDIQDIGARFYTYVSTMANAMEEAAKRGIEFHVLDRPNPITGTRVEGPVLDRELLSFVGYFPLPLRHGMTAGELARLFNEENHIGAKLTVTPVRGWARRDWFDSTGLPWVNPSPNIRNFHAALLYPALAMLEYSTNYSVGRGTESPFEQFGAEFVNGRELAAYLNKRGIGGVRFYPVTLAPTDSNLKGKRFDGVRIVVTERGLLSSARLGLEIASALEKLYPGKIDFAKSEKLMGSRAVVEMLKTGAPVSSILASLEERLQQFGQLRSKYLLYQ